MRLSRYWLLLSLAVVILCAATWADLAMGTHPNEQDVFKPATPVATDMTEQQSVNKGLELLAAIGSGETSRPSRMLLTYDQFLRRVREMHWQNHSVTLDSTTGDLIEYKNEKRQQEQVHGINRTMPYQVRSEQQAKSLIWHYASAMGAPAGASLSDFRFFGENDPRVSDANKAGDIQGKLSLPAPGGYPFNKWSGHPGATIEVDPLDGALVRYAQEWRVYPTSATPQVSASQAVALATPIHNAFRSQRQSFNSSEAQGVSASPPTLEYVSPNENKVVNGSVVFGKHETRFPRSLKLAWVVRFGEDEVWIDAVDGTHLGTIIMK